MGTSMRTIKPMASLGAGLLGRTAPARRVPLSFAPAEIRVADAAEVPEVVLQVTRLAQAFAAELPADPVAAPGPSSVAVRRVAFTLRLDPVHHDRLRRISAAQQRSAQQVLIEALDCYVAGVSGAATIPVTLLSHRKALNGNPS